MIKLNKKIYARSKEILQDNKIAYKYMRYLYNFLLSYDNAFKEEKKNEGIAEFNDIMHYALELLVDEEDNLTDIAYRFKQRYKEVYTDEYQDTSYVQERILQAVSSEDNRFMVGDIKQSIYAFRQARPDIFNEKYNTYKKYDDGQNEEKNNKIILSQNFRSRQEVIDSINYIFEKIMSAKNGQCNYGEDESLKCGNKEFLKSEECSYTTQLNIIDLKEPEKDYFKDEEENKFSLDEDLTATQIEAKCIAYKIQDIVSNMKVQDKGAFRNATYKDIVILLRSTKNKADVIESILKENNIPVFCDTSTSLFEGDEVKLILSFLRILDNPYQDIYMVSVMYSIIGNFTLDEITKIRLYNSTSYIYDTLCQIAEDEEYAKSEEEIYSKVKDFLNIIDIYTKYSKIYSISDLLIRIYKDTNIYYQLALENDASSKKANLDYLIELASNFYSNISNTLNSYIRYIDSLKDKQDKSSASAKIIGENENVVRIMTIHKSKGLEFPIVILADTAKGYNLTDIWKGKVLFHYNYGIGINIVNQDLGITYPSLIKQAIKSVMEKETKSEEIRLLYVALTRAKEKLYIFATTKDYKKQYKAQSINIRNGKFNETLIASNSSYYQNLLPVIKYYNDIDNNNSLDINTIEVKENITDENLKRLLSAKSVEKDRMSISEHIDKLNSDKKIKCSNDIISKVKENIEKDYKYIEDTHTPSRVSVSNLKKNKYEEEQEKIVSKFEDENENAESKTTLFSMPSYIAGEENKYTAVRKGLLIHFILQNLDFNILESKQDIKNYISKLVLENVISEADSKYISVNRIYNFLNSNIGKELKKAKEIYREYEFILKNDNISKSIIQGIIDLFYVTEDGRVILVDFKTDKLDNEIDYINRYKIQLDIYKEAINTLTKYKVDKVYIYSFNLNKEIEVMEE